LITGITGMHHHAQLLVFFFLNPLLASYYFFICDSLCMVLNEGTTLY
jgi:hypothetical protein